MIAEVIVDVPALGTDKVFDYVIPEKWLKMAKHSRTWDESSCSLWPTTYPRLCNGSKEGK